jgi:hypothetical protein
MACAGRKGLRPQMSQRMSDQPTLVALSRTRRSDQLSRRIDPLVRASPRTPGSVVPGEARPLSGTTVDADSSTAMFLFFSSGLGCIGSLIVSAGVTILLLMMLGVISPFW